MVGDGPDCRALAQISRTLGWECRRVEHASELSGPYDDWTVALVKTHNDGRDFAALRVLLPLNLRYVGLLGPRRRRQQLLGDFLDTGVSVSENFFAPAIVASRYGGILGTQALFSDRYLPRLRALSADAGARSILKESPNAITAVDLPDALVDIDSEADWKNFQCEQAKA